MSESEVGYQFWQKIRAFLLIMKKSFASIRIIRLSIQRIPEEFVLTSCFFLPLSYEGLEGTDTCMTSTFCQTI